MQYEMNYDGGEPRQSGAPADTASLTLPENRPPKPKKTFRIGEAGRSALLIIGTTGLILASERILPEGSRLTDLVGVTSARFEAYQVRVNTQAQAELDTYVRAIDVVNQQNVKLTEAILQSQLQNYEATYSRANVFAQETARMQGMLVQSRLTTAQGSQATDLMVINFARLWGRVSDALSPGSGSDKLTYADNLRDNLYRELDTATQTGTTIAVEGWNTDLPSPADVRAQIATFQLAPLPAPPRIGISPPASSIDQH